MGFIIFGAILAAVSIVLSIFIPYTALYALGFAWVVYSWWLEQKTRYGTHAESHNAKRVGFWARVVAFVGAVVATIGAAIWAASPISIIMWALIAVAWAFFAYSQYNLVQISKITQHQYEKWSRF